MNNIEFPNLKFIPFSDLFLWDFKRYSSVNLKSKYNIVKLSNYLKEENVKIKPFENPEQKYEILGVNNKTGLFDAYVEFGKNINQPYKIVKNGFLVYNPYRVNVGSVGLKTNKQKYQYISPAYVVFSCKEGLLPEFLYKLFKTNRFNELIRENTTGSVRQSLSFSSLVNIKIPVPPIERQQKILEKYNDQIKLIEEQEKEILILEKQIETFLFSSLGITILNNAEKEDNNYLKVVELKDLDRWDIFSQNFSIENILNKSKFSLKRLGKEYNFINRAWNKKEYKKKQFFYIEIGDIDPILGITNAKELNIEKAPSRATQIIKNKDLIIGTTRPYLKKFAIVDNKYDSCICSSGFSVIESSSKYNLSFLKEYLMSSIGTEQLKNNMSGGLYPAITTEKFKNIKIPIPPLDIQNEIVYQIDIIRNKIKQLKKDVEQNKVLAQNEFEKELFL